MSFVGYCRDEGGSLAALELEHYPGMAEEEIARAAGEAEARWPLLGATVIHRYGRIAPGERIVFVAVAAAHRGAAFAAAEMLMDYLKTRAPFWKRAIRRDGAVEGWIECQTGRRQIGGALERRRRLTVHSGAGGDRVVDQQYNHRADDCDDDAPDVHSRDAADTQEALQEIRRRWRRRRQAQCPSSCRSRSC